MSILLLDIGNSSVVSCLYRPKSADEFSDVEKHYYPPAISAAFFTGLWQQREKPGQVIASSVSSEVTWEALNSACETLWGITPRRLIAEKQACGVINAYSDVASLGSDRWCAMIAAFDEFNTDVMVVDCGTALTIDIVSADENRVKGQHQGGYILPGLLMMKKSLGMNTASISVDETLPGTSMKPANSTEAGINAASYLATVAFIETVFRQQQEKYPGLKCILTGGDAALLAQTLSIQYISRPELVLHGLACIANDNHK